MPRRELPHIIDTKGVNDPVLAAKLRAIMENFDALTGQAGFTEDSISDIEDRLDNGDLTVPEDAIPTDTTLEDALNEAGEGTPDGSPPASSPAPRAYSILGAIYLLADTIVNNSTVTYHFHVSTTNGFTPAANTKVASVQAAGRTGQVASFIVRQFPTGHHLAGQQPSATTTYYAKVVAEDSDGVAPASAQVTASSEMINSANKAIYLGANIIEGDMIVGNAIDGKTITGATIISPNANAGTWRVEISGPSGWPVRYWDGSTVNFALKADGSIYARGEIVATSGTFTGTVSASAVVGSTISGGSIIGTNIETAQTNVPRIYIASSTQDINWVDANSYFSRAIIGRSSGNLNVVEQVGQLRLYGNTGINIDSSVVNKAVFSQGLQTNGRIDFNNGDGGTVGTFSNNLGSILIQVGGVNRRIPYW